ncbi:hypothetical protein Hanom_Chr16g01472801 [Helianthus anomalus]
MKWNLYAKAFYLKLHSTCGNIPPLSYQSLEVPSTSVLVVADGISSDQEVVVLTSLRGRCRPLDFEEPLMGSRQMMR